MNSAHTAIVLGAGASYCYKNGFSIIPTQANIIESMYMGIGTSSGEGAPNFIDNYGLRHSFELAQFIREDLGIKELDSNDKLDFWKRVQELKYNLESLYEHIENNGDQRLLEDFKAIIRSCVLRPAGERQREQVCQNHRAIARALDPGDFVLNFNWDTLMSDALLYESPFWFPGTGFGIAGVSSLLHEKAKRHNVGSLVHLLHIHGCAALYEEESRADAVTKHFVYLGGKTYSPMNSLMALTGIGPAEAAESESKSSKQQPTEEELLRLDHGWLY
jgi:hypothetical protein